MKLVAFLSQLLNVQQFYFVSLKLLNLTVPLHHWQFLIPNTCRRRKYFVGTCKKEGKYRIEPKYLHKLLSGETHLSSFKALQVFIDRLLGLNLKVREIVKYLVFVVLKTICICAFVMIVLSQYFNCYKLNNLFLLNQFVQRILSAF